MTSTDVRVSNISQSLPHKIAENSWYEEITSLSPYVYDDARLEQTRVVKYISTYEAAKCVVVAVSGDDVNCRSRLPRSRALHRCDCFTHRSHRRHSQLNSTASSVEFSSETVHNYSSVLFTSVVGLTLLSSNWTKPTYTVHWMNWLRFGDTNTSLVKFYFRRGDKKGPATELNCNISHNEW